RRRLRDRGGAGEDGDQAAGVRPARRRRAGARDPRLEHLLAVDLRDRRRHVAARPGDWLSLLLPRLRDAPDRDRRGGGDLRRADPYRLIDLLGLDTVLHVAEHLQQAYGEERFYVPKGMQKLVSEGKLGAKSGGAGFYDPAGNANIDGEGEPDVAELVELLSLK